MHSPVVPQRQGLSPWIQLAKPGVTRLVLFTTFFGGVMTRKSASWWTWALALVGSCLVVAAANALNMVAERDSDALMSRTANRPLPQGKISVAAANWAAYIAAALGLGMLLTLNLQAAFVALLALVSYVWAYTPLKRVTPLALYVGTLPGAAPPVIGYAAISGGTLDAAAWVLFLILVIWQIPHFLAIAIFRRDEYERAGIQVFSVCCKPRAVRLLMLFWTWALFIATLSPMLFAMGSTLYLAVAIGFGLPFVAGAIYGLRSVEKSEAADDRGADNRWARSFFFASIPHLVVLFLALAV